MNSLSLIARRTALSLAGRRAAPAMVHAAMGSQTNRVARSWLSTAPRQTFAVDAPDGTSDDIRSDELHAVEDIVEFAAAHEDVDAVNKLHAEQDEAKKIFAVDSPDGTSDAAVETELHEVEEIIDFAAAHEDKDKINKRHAAEEAITKERIRDPEHDW